ncbi:MAG: Rad52/Rad22 family DNA repair protein [Candidatus Latescibacteria bacterium]|nr:Rad52/Rad22 family DNA repair protein [Candidatus Latescibacterota bacterium]
MNLELLKRPFSTDQIKHRRTSIGLMVAYLETPTIITRLNEVFNGEWSFQIVDHKFLDNDVVVLGEIMAGGVSKQQFGTCELQQDTEDGVVLSVGDALKAATSDALKKTATLYGIGLQLYGVPADESLSESGEPSPVVSEPSGVVAETSTSEDTSVVTEELKQTTVKDDDLDDLLGAPEPPSNQVTELQLAEIFELVRQRKFTKDQVNQRARSRYGRDLSEITQDEAQDIIDKLKGN